MRGVLMSDTSAIDGIEVTPRRLRKLLRARLVDRRSGMTLIDRRGQLAVWRDFASSTAQPLATGLLGASAVMTFASSEGAEKQAALALGFLAGTGVAGAAALLAFLMGRRRRCRFSPLGLLLTEAIPSAHHAEARALCEPSSLAAIVGCIALYACGGPAIFVVEGLARAHGGLCALAGGAMVLAGAVFTRRRRVPMAVGHLGVVLGGVGTVWLAAALAAHLNLPSGWVQLVVLAVCLLGLVAVASLPARMVGTFVVGVGCLAALGDAGLHRVERADDVAFIALAVLTTTALTRRRVPGAWSLGCAVSFLIFASVEVPSVGQATALALGSASSLGAMACLVALALVVTRTASVQARALVASLVAAAGFLLVNAPAVLAAVLIGALARHARVRALELISGAAVFLFAHAWASTSFHAVSETSGTLVVVAFLVFSGAITLRRLPPSVTDAGSAPAASSLRTEPRSS